MSASITAGYRVTVVYPTTSRLFPTQLLLPVCTVLCYVVTVTDRPDAALLLQKNLGRLLLYLVHLATLC